MTTDIKLLTCDFEFDYYRYPCLVIHNDFDDVYFRALKTLVINKTNLIKFPPISYLWLMNRCINRYHNKNIPFDPSNSFQIY